MTCGAVLTWWVCWDVYPEVTDHLRGVEGFIEVLYPGAYVAVSVPCPYGLICF